MTQTAPHKQQKRGVVYKESVCFVSPLSTSSTRVQHSSSMYVPGFKMVLTEFLFLLPYFFHSSSCCYCGPEWTTGRWTATSTGIQVMHIQRCFLASTAVRPCWIKPWQMPIDLMVGSFEISNISWVVAGVKRPTCHPLDESDHVTCKFGLSNLFKIK